MRENRAQFKGSSSARKAMRGQVRSLKIGLRREACLITGVYALLGSYRFFSVAKGG